METQLVELAIASQHFQFTTRIQRNARSRLGRLAGTNLRACTVVRQQALDQDFDPSTCLFLPENTRRNDPRVVEHQQVARPQPLHQVTHLLVDESSPLRWHHQQAAGRTLGQRRLGDQRLGQVVVEVGFLHRGGLLRERIVAACPPRPRRQTTRCRSCGKTLPTLSSR